MCAHERQGTTLPERPAADVARRVENPSFERHHRPRENSGRNHAEFHLSAEL
jgi:hypothetical protein